MNQTDVTEQTRNLQESASSDDDDIDDLEIVQHIDVPVAVGIWFTTGIFLMGALVVIFSPIIALFMMGIQWDFFWGGAGAMGVSMAVYLLVGIYLWVIPRRVGRCGEWLPGGVVKLLYALGWLLCLLAFVGGLFVGGGVINAIKNWYVS